MVYQLVETCSKIWLERCLDAGIKGQKTNHSLRVSGTTSLFAAGVPERVIQSRTGHSSLEALRKYERVTIDQEKAVSKILSGETTSYNVKSETSSYSLHEHHSRTADVSTEAVRTHPIYYQLIHLHHHMSRNCWIQMSIFSNFSVYFLQSVDGVLSLQLFFSLRNEGSNFVRAYINPWQVVFCVKQSLVLAIKLFFFRFF